MNVERTTGGIALAAILVMGASALFLFNDYRSEAENHRNVLLARGQTALDALVAGLRAQGRMGRYRHDRLSLIFEELATTPDVIGVALHTLDGTLISSGGSTGDMNLAGGNIGTTWSADTLTLSRSIELEIGGHGPGRGRGAFGDSTETEAWEPMPEGPHALTIQLDTTSLTHELRGDWFRFLISLVGVVLLVALGSATAVGAGRRRRLQSALLVAQAEAAHQEQLTRLGAGLAHETKNPLGIVRGQAQLIVDTPEDVERNRERAERIVDEIDRAVGHINGFLNLARPADIDPRPLELGGFLEQFGALMEGEARQHQVLLAIDAPECWIRADENQLRKALLNVVLNALRATRAGGRIDIQVDCTGHRCGICVRDTGCGIAPEDLARVYEPYFTRSEDGCGLGLTLVEQIARSHGWTLVIDSEVGVGTSLSLKNMEKVMPPA